MNASHYNHARIVRLRKAAQDGEGISQDELAKEIGVCRMTIWRAEKGIAASYELISSIADYFGKPVTYLLYSRPVAASKNFTEVLT